MEKMARRMDHSSSTEKVTSFMESESGAPEWDLVLLARRRYTLDNRRLYCLQKAAVALYPKEAGWEGRIRSLKVRVLVKLVRQEDGSCREAGVVSRLKCP